MSELDKQLACLAADVPPVPEGFHARWTEAVRQESGSGQGRASLLRFAWRRAAGIAAVLILLVGGAALLRARQGEKMSGTLLRAAQTKQAAPVEAVEGMERAAPAEARSVLEEEEAVEMEMAEEAAGMEMAEESAMEEAAEMDMAVEAEEADAAASMEETTTAEEQGTGEAQRAAEEGLDQGAPFAVTDGGAAVNSADAVRRSEEPVWPWIAAAAAALCVTLFLRFHYRRK